MFGGKNRRVGAFALAIGFTLVQPALAQVTSSTIHGIVQDPSGAVIPNASLRLKDVATGLTKTTVGNAEGTFVFPNLVAGSYQLTAQASGFQNAVLDGIVVDAGRTTDVTVSMKVGSATETVEVSATGVQLEATSNEVGTTINNKNIDNLPYPSRDSLFFALFMAGSANANDTSGRNSTYNGLPNASLNITIDGMNDNSQRFKSGGTSFYGFAPQRIDAIEQVTVSTTGLGADAVGEGAMNVRFTTKRGTDQYHFLLGEQFENEALNSNLFFNNLRGQQISRGRQNNAYGSIGGPLVPFIPALKHKLFFFAYMEGQPQPSSSVATATVFTPAAQAGNFTYIGTDGVQRTVNVLSAAGAAGYTSTVDPTIGGILGQINASESEATGFLGITGQPYWQTMQFVRPANITYLFPTARVDYQITPKIAWHGTWNLKWDFIDGYSNYPGEPQYNNANSYKITTYVATNSVDYTITPHMLNNFTFGVQSNLEFFNPGTNPYQWSIYDNRNIVMPSFSGGSIAPVVPTPLPINRNNPVFQLTDNLSWIKGKHSLTMGATMLHTSFYEITYNSAGIPRYNLGLASGDPVGAALQSALPFINTGNGDLSNAQDLYALLTGRLASLTGTVNVDEHSLQYREFAPITNRFAFTTAGIYFQDNFRVSSRLSLNYGFRGQFDGAIKATNGIDGEPTGANFFGPSNGLFQPGVLNGNMNPVINNIRAPYSADLINPAPNIGFAWNPSGKGILHKFLGDGKTVIRGAYALTYYNEGMDTISNLIPNNQGSTQSISAVPGNPGFPLGGVNLSSPTPPLSVFPASFGFPVPEANYVFSGGNALYMVNPNLVTPYVQNWNFGVQRELPSHVVIEARYVGNHSTHQWHYQNINEVNIFENGFLPQFVQAQQNLAINQANGKGNTFINNGLAGQAAIPIFETAFSANGSQPALAAASGFSNSTFVTNLQQGLAGSLANSLASTAANTYYCRLVGSKFAPCAAAGFTGVTPYPINFFSPNPFATSLNYQDDNGANNYNALQVEARKATTHGLTATVNFTWSHAMGDELNAGSDSAGYAWFTLRNGRLSYGPSPFDRRLTFNSYWTYDLPFGKDKRVRIQNPVLDRILGDWTIGGVETIATGAPNILNSGRDTVNNLNQSGVVLGSGLTQSQLRQDLASIPNMNRVVNGNLISNVSGIAQSNGIPNPQYYGPAATPGVFSDLIYLYGATNFSLNMSLNKEIRLTEHLNLGFRVEALNFLNHPFFPLGNTSPIANTFGQISSTVSSVGSTYGTQNANFNRVVLLRAYLNW